MLNTDTEIRAFARTLGHYADSYRNRLLETLRWAINWACNQTPALLTGQPFHKHGIRIRKKGERHRDRRVTPDEQRRLLDAAQEINSEKYNFTGQRLHDGITANLEIPVRLAELVGIQNKHIDYERFRVQITVVKGNGERTQRWVPFDPDGELVKIFERRRVLGNEAYVFGLQDGKPAATKIDKKTGRRVLNPQDWFRTGWEVVRLKAYGFDTKRGPHAKLLPEQSAALKDGGAINLHWHDLRHECATRLWYDFRADLTTIQRMLGHSTPIVTQRYLNLTDDDLDERMHDLWREAKERKERTRRFSVVAGGRKQ